MSLASKIDLDKVREQLARAKASNKVAHSTPQPPKVSFFQDEKGEPEDAPVARKLPVVKTAPIDVRKNGLKSHFSSHLDIDFATISASLGVELNRKIRPMVMQTIIQKKLNQMKADGTINSIPACIWQMLAGLKLSHNDWPSRERDSFDIKKSGDGAIIIAFSLPEECTRLVGFKPFSILLQYVRTWEIKGESIIMRGGCVAAFDFQSMKEIIVNCSQVGHISFQ